MLKSLLPMIPSYWLRQINASRHVSGSSFLYTLLLTLATFLSSPSALAETPVATEFAGGDGSAENPFQISDLSELRLLSEPNFADAQSYHYILTADIDASDTATWRVLDPTDFNPNPIPRGFKSLGDFSGVFDGNGHVIRNLHISAGNPQLRNEFWGFYYGFISRLVGAGIVRDLALEGGSVSGYKYVGGLVGELNGGQIIRCYSSVSVSGVEEVGGLVGNTQSGTIRESVAEGPVTGDFNPYFNAEIRRQWTYYVGGFVGRHEGGSIDSCYSTGNLTLPGGFFQFGGGFAGGGNAPISACYSNGFVPPASFTSGFGGGSTTSCYWDVQTSGQQFKGGVRGVTTAEMMQRATFAGFDFSTPVWRIFDGHTRPFLAWQAPAVIISYAGGDGSEEAPFEIANLSHLVRLSETPADWAPGLHYKITAYIDASEVSDWPSGEGLMTIGFVPTGVDPRFGDLSMGMPFLGDLDGAGYHIIGLTMNRPEWDYQGLFGYLGQGAFIRNLDIEKVSISGKNQVGALVAFNDGGTISNCSSSGTTPHETATTGVENVGGLVGFNSAMSSIELCRSFVSVAGGISLGGLVGFNESGGAITSSYATGAIDAATRNAGGLVGRNEGTIDSSYATGIVDIDTSLLGPYAGGLVGYNAGPIDSTYATGDASAYTGAGGLIGFNEGVVNASYSLGRAIAALGNGGLIGVGSPSLATSCYWNTEISLLEFSAGGEGKTIAEMLLQETYVGFDFNTPEWRIYEGETNPFHVWDKRFPIADLDRNGSVDAVDIQLIINGALGLGSNNTSTDINGDGTTDAVDVQLTILAALGL